MPFANDDSDQVLPDHFDAVAPVLARTDRDQRCLEIDIRLAAAQFAVAHHAAFHLDTELLVAQVRHVDFARLIESEKVRVIELDFGA